MINNFIRFFSVLPLRCYRYDWSVCVRMPNDCAKTLVTSFIRMILHLVHDLCYNFWTCDGSQWGRVLYYKWHGTPSAWVSVSFCYGNAGIFGAYLGIVTVKWWSDYHYYGEMNINLAKVFSIDVSSWLSSFEPTPHNFICVLKANLKSHNITARILITTFFKYYHWMIHWISHPRIKRRIKTQLVSNDQHALTLSFAIPFFNLRKWTYEQRDVFDPF